MSAADSDRNEPPAPDAWATRPPSTASAADPHSTRAEEAPSTDSVPPDLYATRATDEATSVGRIANPSSAAAGTRYRKVRPHARGGLGEVFVAQDEELRREVALKEIQDRHADNPGSRARFLLEAEVTGCLEHPGIVPVYGLGQYLDGRPYYAMRFISGESLEDAIARFHEDDGPKRDPAERSLALRQLLRRFIDTCNAIAYAHSRGVLHRDIKPANVMLGKYGETLVVDWGLAKPLGGTEKVADGDERPVQVSPDSTAVETVAGSVIGTPQFMSPEQAAGAIDTLGPASDVYSLGATLYVLLTGQAPFRGTDASEIVEKVRRGEFTSLREVKPGIPLALEAVCRKAMALKPEERFGTARELSDEVEHWLADEPVSAYREPWKARMGRWMRRHRMKVTAGVAALLVAVIGLGVATVLLTAANDRERAAKELAETNAKRARERFKQAREAIDKFYTAVSDSPEMKAEGVEKLRTKLLADAADYYQRFVQEEEGDEPEVKAELGRTLKRLGALYHDIGRHDDAEKSFKAAQAIFEKVAAADPTIPEYQSDLAGSHNNLGHLYSDTGRRYLAEKAYGEALTIRQKLAAAYPTVPEYQRALADSHNGLANLYSATGRKHQSEKAYQEALTIFQKLAAAHPDASLFQRNLAVSHNNLAILYSATGRNELAEKAYQEALAIFQKLAVAHPTVTMFQSDLAESHHNLAVLFGETDRKDRAEKAYGEALTIRQKLAAAHPTITHFQNRLALSHNNLANLYRATGRNDLAEKAHQEALTIRKKLAVEHPTVMEFQSHLADSLYNLANLYILSGRNDLAEKAYQESLAIRQELAAKHPVVTEFQSGLAACHNNLASLYRATDRKDLAEKAHRAALAIHQKLATEHPTVTEFRSRLASGYNNLANLYRATGRNDQAEKAHGEALAIRKKLAADQPAVPKFQSALADSHNNLGILFSDTGRNDLAEKSLGEALAIRRKLATEHPDVTKYQQDVASCLYSLACVASLGSAEVGKDAKLTTSEQGKRAEQHALRALDLLRQAHDTGYFKDAANIAQLKKDTDLDPLRSRPDFKKFLADLETPPKK